MKNLFVDINQIANIQALEVRRGQGSIEDEKFADLIVEEWKGVESSDFKVRKVGGENGLVNHVASAVQDLIDEAGKAFKGMASGASNLSGGKASNLCQLGIKVEKRFWQLTGN